MAMKAPCPSDTWPLRPVRTVRPATATKYMPIVASWRFAYGVTASESTASTTPATTAIARWRTSVSLHRAPTSDPPHPRLREQAVGPHHQHRDEDHERPERDHARTRVARHVAEREPDDHAARDRARRTLQAAQHRGREAED